MSYDRLSPESPIDDNIALLAKAFPSVVREGKVDFDAIRQILGDDIGEPHELYGLNWNGKAQARRAALTPSLGTLRPCPEESVDWDNTKNLYIEGDNLEVLKLLRKSYSGKVKMIYIDPPYNTGKEFVYPDDYQIGIEHYKKLTEQEGAFPGNVESSGRFHTDWLNMMYPRLLLARDILSNDGVIFLSIDENEVANLMFICDEIFGEFQFRNTFICRRHDKNLNRQFIDQGLKSFNVGFEYILSYSKSSEFMFNPIYRKAGDKRAQQGYWKGFWNAPDRPTMRYDILGVIPQEGQWKWSKEMATEAVKNYMKYVDEYSSKMTLEEYWRKTGSCLKFIRRNPNGNGKNQGVESWVAPDENILRNTNRTDILSSAKDPDMDDVFDFPKNVDLIKMIIKSAACQNDLILDFFSGSATTAHAVMQMNAEDGGNRRFIMVQLPEPCKADTPAGQAGYKNICEIGKERIRRAGKKLKEEAGLIGQGLDTGFRVYKLDSSNVKPWNPDAEDLDASLDLFSEHLVEGRTSDDLLTEVMLKSGIDLCEEMETREIAGHRVYSLGYGQFYACMDLDLSGAEGELALGIAAWHAEECAAVGGEQQDTCTVFVADQAFAGRDDAKMNFVSTLQQYGICKVKAL